MGFFLIFKDQSKGQAKGQSVATKWAKKAKRAFEKPAVSETLARSGLDWLPADPTERGWLVQQLFAAACGRSDYASLSVREPPDGAVSSSLYDEECTPEDRSERRRLQAAALLEVLQRYHRALRSEGSSISHEDVDSSPPTLQQCEQLVAAWQPTAKSPSVDATIKVDWRSTGQFVRELLDAKRAGRSISITAAQEQQVLVSVDASDEPAAALFRCDVGELATKLVNDRDDDPRSAAFGVRLLDQLSSRGDPYACMQMARVLVSCELIEPDPRRALTLAEKGLKGAAALNLRSSVEEAYRTIGEICCFEPGSCNPERGLAAFKKGAALGDYWCAFNLARLLGGKDCEEIRRSHGIERRPDDAMRYLAQADECFGFVCHELDADERRQVRDRHSRLWNEIDGASGGASASEPQP